MLVLSLNRCVVKREIRRHTFTTVARQQDEIIARVSMAIDNKRVNPRPNPRLLPSEMMTDVHEPSSQSFFSRLQRSSDVSLAKAMFAAPSTLSDDAASSIDNPLRGKESIQSIHSPTAANRESGSRRDGAEPSTVTEGVASVHSPAHRKSNSRRVSRVSVDRILEMVSMAEPLSHTMEQETPADRNTSSRNEFRVPGLRDPFGDSGSSAITAYEGNLKRSGSLRRVAVPAPSRSNRDMAVQVTHP